MRRKGKLDGSRIPVASVYGKASALLDCAVAVGVGGRLLAASSTSSLGVISREGHLWNSSDIRLASGLLSSAGQANLTTDREVLQLGQNEGSVTAPKVPYSRTPISELFDYPSESPLLWVLYLRFSPASTCQIVRILT